MPATPNHAITAIGRWSARRPWLAIAVWLAFVVVAVLALALVGTKKLGNGSAGESARADSLMDHYQVYPASQPEYAYLHSDSVRVGDPAFHAAVADGAARMRRALGGSVSIHVSPDRHSALLAATIRQRFSVDALAASVAAVGATHPSVTAALDDWNDSGNSDLQRAERLSVPVTLFVLLVAFGAIVAALVPVLLAATAVIAAFGLLGPISQAFPLDSSVQTVVVLIGMAVGVDYALFYVIRSREERERGLPSHEALARTASTSGRTVLVAGTTVALAMAGQFAIGLAIFNGIASGTIAVVACAVAGSVTVLPAVLELLGPRIDWGRIPFLPHLNSNTDSRFWAALVDRVLRRPVVSLLASGAVLLALAVPSFGLRVSSPSFDASPSQAALQARVSAEFPGTSSPAIVVAVLPDRRRPAVRSAVAQLEASAARTGIAHRPFAVNARLEGRAIVLVLALPLTGRGDNSASKHAISALRAELIPRTLGRLPGAEIAVTGNTAGDVDFTRQMKHGLPYVVGFVLLLAFVLLLVAFRSIVVPLKAIVLNLLSVGASYGVLVLVFQHRWAEGILGFHSNGSIVSWLPIFLFVVLFGLSMDYHVFILSRVREGVDAGMSTDEAVRYGIAKTAGVVTSAALVMFGVFSLFGTATALNLKEAGVGLAVAVVLDATIVRGVLLPASMKLLGERNWYLPRWLDWLPETESRASEPVGVADRSAA